MLVCAILTYGGVSLFVVVFAVYPFAAEMFRQSDIPKRLIPGTIALGAFTFTMDSLARHAADPEHHPDDLLPDRRPGPRPWLGIIGAPSFSSSASPIWNGAAARRPGPAKATENHINEPEPPVDDKQLANPVMAILPLVVVFVLNRVLDLGHSRRLWRAATSAARRHGPRP